MHMIGILLWSNHAFITRCVKSSSQTSKKNPLQSPRQATFHISSVAFGSVSYTDFSLSFKCIGSYASAWFSVRLIMSIPRFWRSIMFIKPAGIGSIVDKCQSVVPPLPEADPVWLLKPVNMSSYWQRPWFPKLTPVKTTCWLFVLPLIPAPPPAIAIIFIEFLFII